MIVATREFNIDEFLKIATDYNSIYNYVYNLIPDRYKHIPSIINNTLYMLNVTILKSNLPLERKQEISNLLSTNIKVVGYLDSYVSIQDIEYRVNMKQVEKYWRNETNGKCL